MPLEDYTYDVFFSYKRHSLTLEWTREVHRRIQFWLTQEIGRDAKVFVDEDCIETGDRWPQVLRDSLRTSRCMVCIWSPLYFQSGWCMSEWASFREREKRLNLDSHGLIAPVRYHDGEHFPEEAKIIQMTDVRPYTYTVPAFWTSPRALELEDKLKELAHDVAGIIGRTPPFADDWPIVDAEAAGGVKIGLAKL